MHENVFISALLQHQQMNMFRCQIAPPAAHCIFLRRGTGKLSHFLLQSIFLSVGLFVCLPNKLLCNSMHVHCPGKNVTLFQEEVFVKYTNTSIGPTLNLSRFKVHCIEALKRHRKQLLAHVIFQFKSKCKMHRRPKGQNVDIQQVELI